MIEYSDIAVHYEGHDDLDSAEYRRIEVIHRTSFAGARIALAAHMRATPKWRLRLAMRSGPYTIVWPDGSAVMMDQFTGPAEYQGTIYVRPDGSARLESGKSL